MFPSQFNAIRHRNLPLRPKVCLPGVVSTADYRNIVWRADPVNGGYTGFMSPLDRRSILKSAGSTALGATDVVYTLRISGDHFTPRVRKPGTYSVYAYDPDGDCQKAWKNLEARRTAQAKRV